MTSTYTPLSPAPARVPVTTSPPGRKWWWWWAAGGVLALALIGGSTAAVLNYLSSQFPNAEEEALLAQVPLELKGKCNRNTDTEPDAANVRASVTCTSDRDVNTVVFTKFTSSAALENRYNTDVVIAETKEGTGRDSGQCRSAKRAEGEYTNESGLRRGRALCYPLLGSSVIEWTEDGSQTLRVATWVDPDPTKLAAWWGGVMNVQPPAPPASPPPPSVAQDRPAPEQVAPKPEQPVTLATKNIFDRAGQRCLSGNKEGKVYTMKCDGADRPNWDLLDNGTILNKQTGHCLTAGKEGGIYLLECNNETEQKWIDIKGTFQNRQTGHCLSRDETSGVFIAKCNNEDYQKWRYSEDQ